MDNIKMNKKIVSVAAVTAIIFLIGVVVINRYGNSVENKKINALKKNIENVFFYLPEDEYSDLNLMPDYCKLSMVYGTKALKNTKYVSSKDLTTIVNKKSKDSLVSYSTNDIDSAVKSVIGSNASINYKENKNGDYNFIIENGCGNNNSSIGILGYNSDKKIIYKIMDKKSSESKLHIKWIRKINNGSNIELIAYALESVKNIDGSYTVYADSEHRYVVAIINKKDNYDKKIDELLYSKSRTYKFIIKKNFGKYTWNSYTIVDNLYDPDVHIN